MYEMAEKYGGHHVTLFISLRCSAQGQGKKENENLEPIVNGVE